MHILATILLAKYGDGLASEKCDVRAALPWTVYSAEPVFSRLTVIFLAAKTSNHPIPIDTYASRIPKTTREDVLDLEFLVAQSLGFEFVVWHAYRSLWGIYLDIQVSVVWHLTSNNERLHTLSRKQTLPDLEGQFNSIHEAYIAAIAHVRAARLTDVELIYTPSQIALACWHLVSPGLAEQWARAKFEPDVISILPEIAQMILGDGKPPDVERVREIDKRLRICKNPEKVPGTKA